VPRSSWKPASLTAAALAWAAASGCSLLVDRSDQCRTDADCAHFDSSHPLCKAGVCVASGLGPPGCYFGAPSNQSHFANACSTSQFVSYDNCGRLGICRTDVPFPDAVVPPKDLGMVPAIVKPQPTPVVPCVHPTRPNLIYATGSTNLLPLLRAVAPLLAANDPPYTVIYQPQTSCRGAGSMFEADAAKRMIRDIKDNYAFFYDDMGTKNYCLLHPDGNPVDIGESDVYASTCGYQPKEGIADYIGPIQAITFVVPSLSSQRSISAEAAHYVFGTGSTQPAAPPVMPWSPWIDPTYFFVRSSGTGTTQLASRAILVPPNAWWGIDRLSSDNLRDALETVEPNSAEKAIGVLSSDFADKARGSLRVLAFQSYGQAVGYLPDSTPSSYDKANVRDGHYPIWGPIHLYAAVSQGMLASRGAEALITRLTLSRLDQELLDAVVQSGYIPSCAMRVKRDQEMGPLIPFQPPISCSCYYEKLVNGRSTCQACGGPGDCPTTRPACNYGFCEAQP
jgi:hypothetical protein